MNSGNLPTEAGVADPEICAHWDWCPYCRNGLDTGLECDQCGADLMPVQKALEELQRRRSAPEPASTTETVTDEQLDYGLEYFAPHAGFSPRSPSTLYEIAYRALCEVKRLRAAPEPRGEYVRIEDMVEGSHPDYGPGLFATRNAVRTGEPGAGQSPRFYRLQNKFDTSKYSDFDARAWNLIVVPQYEQPETKEEQHG